MTATPEIAAIICTHNRANYLGAAIDSVLDRQTLRDFELLVVDNASSDHTQAVVEARLPHPQLTYIYEAKIGLSVARNTGWQQSTAPILVYLDDDAEASPQWLAEHAKAFADNDQLAVTGGQVSLIWPPNQSAPTWMSPGLSGNLGYYNLGDRPVSITQANLTPRGLNYGIRRTFLEQIGGFDPNLGRIGTSLLSNEELYMTELALAQGWEVYYLPEAIAAHHVALERLQLAWFLRRSWWQGVSECYREAITGRSGLGQLGRGGERLIRGLVKSVKYIADPALRMDNLIYAYGQLGYLQSAINGLLFSSIDANKSSTDSGSRPHQN